MGKKDTFKPRWLGDTWGPYRNEEIVWKRKQRAYCSRSNACCLFLCVSMDADASGEGRERGLLGYCQHGLQRKNVQAHRDQTHRRRALNPAEQEPETPLFWEIRGKLIFICVCAVSYTHQCTHVNTHMATNNPNEYGCEERFSERTRLIPVLTCPNPSKTWSWPWHSESEPPIGLGLHGLGYNTDSSKIIKNTSLTNLATPSFMSWGKEWKKSSPSFSEYQSPPEPAGWQRSGSKEYITETN